MFPDIHVSGLLKVAPEHIADNVLDIMGKPANAIFEGFRKKFYRINEKTGKEQYLVPYFILSHPGSTMDSAIELAEYLRDINHIPEQVQDFYPTPGTLSTTMYYTGYDPPDYGKGLCAQEQGREEDAESITPVHLSPELSPGI